MNSGRVNSYAPKPVAKDLVRNG